MAVATASSTQLSTRRTFTEPIHPGLSTFTLASIPSTNDSDFVPPKVYGAKNTSNSSLLSSSSLSSHQTYRHCENLSPWNISQTTIERVQHYAKSSKSTGIRNVSGHSSLQTVICARAGTPEIRISTPDDASGLEPHSTQDFSTPFDTPERPANHNSERPYQEDEDASNDIGGSSNDLLLCRDELQPVENAALLASTPSAPTLQVPLRRWISTLRRRGRKHRLTANPFKHDQWAIGWETDGALGSEDHYRSPSFNSSLDLLSRTKTASIGIGSSSVALSSPQTDLLSVMRRPHRRSGFSDQRTSIDSSVRAAQIMIDERVRERFHKRQHILQELLTSEESYVSDLKTLSTTYFTFLAGGSHLLGRNRVHRAITQIHQLHRELLADLHKIMAHDQGTSFDPSQKSHKRRKWLSSESAAPAASPLRGTFVPLRSSLDTNRPNLASCTFEALVAPDLVQTAKLFDRYMTRFFAYEAFLSNIEIMQADADANFRVIPNWTSQERGVEALAKALLPTSSQENYSRKGLTFDDLLIKPVQRICKYALFFADLCRHTPSCDDPVAHEWLERIRTRLDDTAAELDKATDNPVTRQCIEMSWRLEDRLVFPANPTLSKAITCRLLGHVILCGVLHVAYTSVQDHTRGHFSIAILYRSKLVLASASKDFSHYVVDAILPLAYTLIDEADNGRGLKCHTAPFSWKLGFEHRRQRYEVLLSACTQLEEDVWRDRLHRCIAAELEKQPEDGSSDVDRLDFIPPDSQPLNQVWRHQNPPALSALQRSATVGPKSGPQLVIIRNTTASRAGELMYDDSSIVRSQSHSSHSNLPVLAPRRAERIRLEACLHDVWTRDLLPYPGMPIRKLDNPIRASAQSMMRKFSMTSLASNFSRRSASQASLKQRRRNDDSCTASTRSTASTNATSVSGGKPAAGNVHQVILPEDFDQPLKHAAKRDQYAVIPSIVEKTSFAQRSVVNKLQRRSWSENKQTLARSARASLALSRPSMQVAGPVVPQEASTAPDRSLTVIAPMRAQAPVSKEHQKRRRAGGRLLSLARFWA